jgi:hypothetical protein
VSCCAIIFLKNSKMRQDHQSHDVSVVKTRLFPSQEGPNDCGNVGLPAKELTMKSIVWLVVVLSVGFVIAGAASVAADTPSSTLILHCGSPEPAVDAPLPSTAQAAPPAAVPEPSTLILMGLGLLGLLRLAHRQA